MFESMKKEIFFETWIDFGMADKRSIIFENP